MTKLIPGDRVQFEKTDAKGKARKFKGVVADAFIVKVRGESLEIPVIRPRNSAKNRLNIDNPSQRIKPPKIQWIKRGLLRKLPSHKLEGRP